MKLIQYTILFFGICLLWASCKSDAVKTSSESQTTTVTESNIESADTSTLDTTSTILKDTLASQIPSDTVAIVKEASPKVAPKPKKKAKKKTPVKKKQKIQKVEKVNPEDFAKKNEAKGKPELAFKRNFFDFGKIDQGTQLDHDFIVYNLGTAPLIVYEVKSPCDCTTITYPKEPIGPDQQAAIRFQYNSKTKLGKQNPILTVVTNAEPAIHKLYVEGEVILEEQESEQESVEELPVTTKQDSIKE